MPVLRDCPPLDELPRLFGSRIVTVSQLESLGFNRRTIAYRCRPGGPWVRMAPGIVKLDNGPVTREDHRWAALAHAGAGACITGLDGLSLAGFRSIPAPFGPVHVLIPHDRRRVGRTLALVERTDRLPVPSAGRWPLAPVPRAVLDFARRTNDRPMVRTVVAEAVQQRHCSVRDLAVELRRGCQRGSAMPRAVLAEISDGVRSAAEANARTVVRDLVRSGLVPVPLWNASWSGASPKPACCHARRCIPAPPRTNGTLGQCDCANGTLVRSCGVVPPRGAAASANEGHLRAM